MSAASSALAAVSISLATLDYTDTARGIYKYDSAPAVDVGFDGGHSSRPHKTSAGSTSLSFMALALLGFCNHSIFQGLSPLTKVREIELCPR